MTTTRTIGFPAFHTADGYRAAGPGVIDDVLRAHRDYLREIWERHARELREALNPGSHVPRG